MILVYGQLMFPSAMNKTACPLGMYAMRRECARRLPGGVKGAAMLARPALGCARNLGQRLYHPLAFYGAVAWVGGGARPAH